MAPSTTVPSAASIEVPETLLKKRKQNEKAREDRLAAATAARKVIIFPSFYMMHIFYFEWLVLTMLPSINHLSGLIWLFYLNHSLICHTSCRQTKPRGK